MATEAPFNAGEAIKKWQKKLDKDLDINLFLIAQDIMRIHLGSQWQTEILTLNSEDLDTYSLHLMQNTSRHQQIHINAEYEDQKEEGFLLSRRISPKGKNRYATYVWIHPQYYRTPGGVKLTDGHFTKTFLDWDPTQTMANRLWYAHLFTLDEQKHQTLEHLTIETLPVNILN